VKGPIAAVPLAAPVVLVITIPASQRAEAPEREAELRALVDTAGRRVVSTLVQHIDRPHAATYLGSGKVDELRALAEQVEAAEIVVDVQLTPSQQRNLEEGTGHRVLDYDELILEIFALNARTHQARLAVALARAEYDRARLKRMWSHLDRQSISGGATGTSGALSGTGEKQIEMDRRQVRKRIQDLRDELRTVASRKDRAVAARDGCFNVCLVGYTNAGKSTLMNALTAAGVLAQDRLFATLDTRSARLGLDAVGRALDVILSDTVGFIRQLPPTLIASFHATLAEVREADLLLHVADCSRDVMEHQIATVEDVLAQIGCDHIPLVMVYNKSDACWSKTLVGAHRKRYPQSALVSARTGEGLDALRNLIAGQALRRTRRSTVRFAAADGRLGALIKARSHVHTEDYQGVHAILDITAHESLVPSLGRQVEVIS
jgi:GTPase